MRIIEKFVILLIILITAIVGYPHTGICEELPFYDAIMKIIQPLEYSGFPVMVKPRVGLKVDFAQRTWILQNIHEYDAQGVVVLEQGRYGLCAELATYVYEKIKPLLNARFEVMFAMATESGFFAADKSNHIVLLMVDRALHEAYLIDPSFHKYARMKDLPEYHVLDIQDSLFFEKDKSPDISFFVDQAIPLYIKEDFLLSFSVISVDGKFDRDNFLFVVSAQRRYKFSGQDILAVGRRNKKIEDFQNNILLQHLLTPDQIKTLEDKFNSWLKLMG